jgi:hypothetical protein
MQHEAVLKDAKSSSTIGWRYHSTIEIVGGARHLTLSSTNAVRFLRQRPPHYRL